MKQKCADCKWCLMYCSIHLKSYHPIWCALTNNEMTEQKVNQFNNCKNFKETNGDPLDYLLE